MSKGSLPKLIIFGNSNRKQVANAIEEFTEFASGKAEILSNCSVEKCESENLESCDFAVVFGGDGAIIYAARTLSRAKVPVIGVNLGKLGFLAEFSVDEIKKYFEFVVTGKAKIEKRLLLDCSIESDGVEKFSSIAVNDVFITSGPPYRAIELQAYVNKQSLAGCLSDGLIISTPTGSTAYNLSANGPILAGEIEGFVITAICPHSLSFRPIVISAESVVEVHGLRLNEGTTVAIDGQIPCKFAPDDVLKVRRHKGSFLVVHNPKRTQWDTLATKLRWAEKPNYKR